MVFIHCIRILLFLALVSIMAAAPAWAQTACPTGVTAGSAQCGPTPQSQGGGAAPPPPREVWVDNWFSHAICTETGHTGMAHTFDTLAEAREGALANCRNNGGTNCVTAFIDKNKCFSIVIAVKDGSMLSEGGGYTTADTLEAAEDRAIGSCMRHYPGAKCRVSYSMCNLRERVL